MEEPESVVTSDLPDLTGMSLEVLRTRCEIGDAPARKRLLEEVGRAARSVSTGGDNSWTV
ncbi:hypothetical protein [Streptomyces sp. NPDC051561]|uniref:hypothetical protein n=1 Tax=Streptomyces sp. NPDC051561 TaxID=3365658 RepID=UPI0037B45664